MRTVFLKRQLHPAHRARNAGRAITFDRTAFALDDLSVFIKINIPRRQRRRHLAIINRRGAPVFQTNHHEAAAAEISRRWVCYRQSEGHCDRGIDCVAATLHDVYANLRSNFVC